MKITIDNYDGLGGVDYTGALSGTDSLTIVRRLNEPSYCNVTLATSGLAIPVSGGRVVVNADNGTPLFTGYVSAAPARVYAGLSVTGPAYQLQVAGVSDEVTLDARVSQRTIECVATSVGDLLQRMTTRASTNPLPISGDSLSTMVGGFQPLAGKSWSSNAGALANAARAAYKAVNEAVLVSNVGDHVHTLSESDGTLDRGALRGGRIRMTANDVTVFGKKEPQAYVTEIFAGDGITSIFELGESPLMESASLLSDTFSGMHIDPQTWIVADANSLFSLTAQGLTIGGGQGASGNSSVSAVDTVEMGGVLTIELSGVQIAGLGEAYLAGLTSDLGSAADFFAGFHLRPSGTAMVAVPMVQGIEAGASTTLQTGHTYTLRVRFHCRDKQRALQSYNVGGANGALLLGSQTLSAGGDLVIEIQETTGGSLLPTTVLYDGSVMQAPSICTPVVINSLSFMGSIANFDMKRPGDVWVRVAASGSSAATQRLGAAAQSAEAKVTSTGRLTFYPGSIPPAGSAITVNYRIGGDAVARMTAPMTAVAGGPAAGSLIVTAEHPETRSSADCENAALALLSISTWGDGAWKGSYSCWNPHQTADVWPGDLLQVEAPSAEISSDLLVRSVQIRATSCMPELLNYVIGFANEWAEPLSLKVNEGAPLNAWLPGTALTSSTALLSLRDLTVSDVSKTQIEIQAGVSAPSGGGFEVRRSDWKFGAGDGADLVLRSPVPNFTIVREAAVEHYYIRMYDNATPPNYSRFSSAVFVNIATQ